MNRKMIFYTIGQLVLLESVLLLLPCVTALVYAEYACALSYFAVAAGAAVVGFACRVRSAVCRVLESGFKRFFARCESGKVVFGDSRGVFPVADGVKVFRARARLLIVSIGFAAEDNTIFYFSTKLFSI